MGITYFKRYRMEFDLTRRLPDPPPLPPRFAVHAWHPNLMENHIDAKFRSFRYEIDANIFPCFHDRDGCARLMREITQRDGFIPEATWLITYAPIGSTRAEPCATIQGLWDSRELGAVQNVGVVPAHRGCGLGTLLIHLSLNGFRDVGAKRVYLEVTAQNLGAFRLYQRLGWRKVRTVYKAAEVTYV